MFVFKRMTKTLIHGDENMTVGQAHDLMREKKIRHLPITDEAGKLLGIVSDRDVRSALPSDMVGADSPYWQDSSYQEKAAVILNAPVASLMTKNPVRVAPFDTLQDMLLLMQRNRVGALPVVDENGFLKGILSAGDILNAFIEVLGITEAGTLLCVLAPSQQGQMKKLVDVISAEGISTGSILVARGLRDDRKAFFPYLLTYNVARVKKRLMEEGFELLNPAEWYLDQLPKKT
ncbi:MAG: CBS and ACT domain-containing protein [Desulfobulbaceae bacterium]|jgi:acetoin utilization protein AcuB|nr:CBS and ACT domain-containing protein [Desulfobulbaceae bacterium]